MAKNPDWMKRNIPRATDTDRARVNGSSYFS